jgi:hypothetical protein
MTNIDVAVEAEDLSNRLVSDSQVMPRQSHVVEYVAYSAYVS